MKRPISAALALTVALCSAAIAADIPVKSPPVNAPAVPVWTWSGFYLGIDGGYGLGSDDFTQTEVRSPGAVTEGSFASNMIAPKGGLLEVSLGLIGKPGRWFSVSKVTYNGLTRARGSVDLHARIPFLMVLRRVMLRRGPPSQKSVNL